IALLLMLLYGWASIPFSYLVSLVFKKGSTGFSTIVGICAIIGVGVGSILKVIELLLAPYVEDLRKVNQAVWAFVFSQHLALQDLEFNCQSPIMNIHNPLFKCCQELCGDHCLKPTYPIQWDMHFCGRDILFLCIDGIIYFALLLLFETRVMATFWRIIKFHFQKIRRRVVGQVIQDTICEDSDVYEEEERIKNLTENHPGSAGEALVTVDLTKVYKNFYAVNHLTFGIHQEECFGLLGVNGAGKTTTFRMLTGDCYPTEGNAIIQNCSLKTNVKKFQSFLGYCPQFDALIDRLSGREMLTLFARLRGLTGSDLEERVDKLIKMTDLTKHADKQTQFYSGGNKRKLSIAIALVGCPPLILLDEPTAGVDPVSRRKIWNILSQARNNTGAAVLLTTHNMEECEALCNRLAIMVNGRFRCLGSIQHLKTKYGQGYSLIIKLKREDQNDHVSMEAIKKHVQTHLRGANLKDDHQGMLQYHVVDSSITLSRLFKFMANMKTEFELEDYLISDTSLEQIFLTFARAQRISFDS
ncbi:ATP-binding cassette sub-family A member 3, partial [Caerostris extrusa]